MSVPTWAIARAAYTTHAQRTGAPATCDNGILAEMIWKGVKSMHVSASSAAILSIVGNAACALDIRIGLDLVAKNVRCHDRAHHAVRRVEPDFDRCQLAAYS